ncbi:methylenetetrahydrofolate reductase C-terminal domain-containing protein [bacterium]
MIKTEKKLYKEIIENLSDKKPVYIIGCAACAAKCNTGGEEQVLDMHDRLTNDGFNVTGYAVLDTPCDSRIVRRDVLNKIKNIDDMQLVVCACGSGVQTIAELLEINVIAALDTIFIGSTQRLGLEREFCKACGDCKLNENASYCTQARCPKSMKNGPCSGVIDGKCEVNPENECIWYLIYRKKKTIGNYKSVRKNKESRE